MRWRLLLAVLTVAVAIVLIARHGHPRAASPALSTATPTVRSGGSGGPAGAVATDATDATTVPDVVGTRLVDAKAVLDAQGLTDVAAVDISGQGRTVLNTQNWIVREQVPEAGSPVRDGARITLKVTKPTDTTGAGRAQHPGVVPDVVCAELDTARAELAAAGFDDVDAEDGLHRGRTPILDENWLVTAQSPGPGSRPRAGTTVVVEVVKYSEPTGGSGCAS